ncbi:MAG: endonuclease/exonuclease/phosphatase family protein [Bacteroidales bacterium]|nr:endonuclease/exonuclease/phosphatase family protein [Bacteroidales bacterium]
MKLINLFAMNTNITNIVNKYTLILLFTANIFTVNAQQGELKIMSFNIGLSHGEDHRPPEKYNKWKDRKNAIVQVILDYSPDILGMQEPMEVQYKFFADTAATKIYQSFKYPKGGIEAPDQSNPIFYKKDVLEVLDKGRYWYSEDPARDIDSWGVGWTSVCTWGKFRVKANGFVFYFFNNHLFDPPQAQLNSVFILLDKIKEIAGDYPVVLTGDFNFNHNEDGMDFLTHTPRKIKDSNCEASKIGKNLTPDILTTGGWGPYTDRTEEDERCWGIMDHIFYTNPFQVESYAIDTTTYNGVGGKRRSPSDHRPIVATLKFTNH